MKKKKSTPRWISSLIVILIIIALLIGAFFVLKSMGFELFNFNITLNNQTLINQLNNDPSGSCYLTISPTTILLGGEITGTINADANTECLVFAKQVGTDDWTTIYAGTTNENGVLYDSTNVDVLGTFDFRAVCGNCITNKDNLIVTGSDCSETDGGRDKDVPGITTSDGTSYMDICLDVGEAVTEYYCSGSTFAHENIACDLGQICVDTRSGGHCQDSLPDVGDIIDSVSDSGNQNANGGSSNSITLDGWTPGGNYVLGARIHRSWSIPDPECQMPQQYPVTWTFFDSNGIAWLSDDYNPIASAVEICPVAYHPDSPWALDIWNGLDCAIDYEWEVEAYICEVLD
jgi:hypothetical protein